MEGRQGMRPAPEQLRAHCQYFSRLGWALFGYMAAMLAVADGGIRRRRVLAPGLLVSRSFCGCCPCSRDMGPGGLVFFLVVRGVPAPPPAPARPMGPGKLLRSTSSAWAPPIWSISSPDLDGGGGPSAGGAGGQPGGPDAAYPMLLNVLLGCVIAPVMEELIFRKLLLSRLRPYGSRFALWASALCFGLFHGNLNQFFYACAVGLVLGWAALSSGRIWQPILLHAGLNAVSTVLLPLLEPLGGPGGGPAEPAGAGLHPPGRGLFPPAAPGPTPCGPRRPSLPPLDLGGLSGVSGHGLLPAALASALRRLAAVSAGAAPTCSPEKQETPRKCAASPVLWNRYT